MATKQKAPKQGTDYPNIIEEPIRVVGDQTRGKSKASKSRKQPSKKSSKAAGKKSRKK